MSDRRKEAEAKMAKAIFISADCWLCVFDLLPSSQLGLGIALISHRFDFYVDEHFKTRKRALKPIRIRSKIGENGTNEMKIVNFHGKPLPVLQIQMPRKVIGFKIILITFIDQNAIAFLHRFHQLFASFCPINLIIHTNNQCILLFIWRNIWPMIVNNICGIGLYVHVLRRLRKFVPSFLNDCPSLRFVSFICGNFFAEFPADDSAKASDGQAVAKWLFTPLQNDVPKVLRCFLYTEDGNLASKIEALKTAFDNSSSPANFIVDILFPFADSVMPFNLINELTGEQLTLKMTDHNRRFLLIRCPIVRDPNKWAKWEKEAIGWHIRDQWNQMHIRIYRKDDIGDGFLDATPGQSDQQK